MNTAIAKDTHDYGPGDEFSLTVTPKYGEVHHYCTPPLWPHLEWVSVDRKVEDDGTVTLKYRCEKVVES